MQFPTGGIVRELPDGSRTGDFLTWRGFRYRQYSLDERRDLQPSAYDMPGGSAEYGMKPRENSSRGFYCFRSGGRISMKIAFFKSYAAQTAEKGEMRHEYRNKSTKCNDDKKNG